MSAHSRTTLDPATAQAAVELHEAAAQGVLRIVGQLRAVAHDPQLYSPGDTCRRVRVAYQGWLDVALTVAADLDEMAAAVAGTIDESVLIDTPGSAAGSCQWEFGSCPWEFGPGLPCGTAGGLVSYRHPRDRHTDDGQPAVPDNAAAGAYRLGRLGRDIELILAELFGSVGPALDDWAGAAAHHYRGLACSLRYGLAELDAIVGELTTGPASVDPAADRFTDPVGAGPVDGCGFGHPLVLAAPRDCVD